MAARSVEELQSLSHGQKMNEFWINEVKKELMTLQSTLTLIISELSSCLKHLMGLTNVQKISSIESNCG